jgi:hypothetical protein
VGEILARVPGKQLMSVYSIAAFEGLDQFLQHIAEARGKLKKGGVLDVQVRRSVWMFHTLWEAHLPWVAQDFTGQSCLVMLLGVGSCTAAAGCFSGQGCTHHPLCCGCPPTCGRDNRMPSV